MFDMLGLDDVLDSISSAAFPPTVFAVAVLSADGTVPLASLNASPVRAVVLVL